MKLWRRAVLKAQKHFPADLLCGLKMAPITMTHCCSPTEPRWHIGTERPLREAPPRCVPLGKSLGTVWNTWCATLPSTVSFCCLLQIVKKCFWILFMSEVGKLCYKLFKIIEHLEVCLIHFCLTLKQPQKRTHHLINKIKSSAPQLFFSHVFIFNCYSPRCHLQCMG